MTIEYAKAIREATSLLIGIAGPSGSGKTFTALEIATGLVGPKGKIFVADSEGGRALHYADQFDFMHAHLHPPFTPESYTEAIVIAEKAGADAIIIDSTSHEYAGEGGIIELADQLERSGGPKGTGIKSPGNWNIPKTKHKRMVNRFIQSNIHMIFCLRAEEKMLMKKEKDPKTGYSKTIVIAAEDRPLGQRWHAICEKNFMFEMTVSMLLLDDKPGVPAHFYKLQEQHKFAFKDGKQIDKNSGSKLAEWAGSGKKVEREKPDDTPAPMFEDATPKTLEEKAQAKAEKGIEALQLMWDDLDDKDKRKLKPNLEKYKEIAYRADAK